MYKFLYNEARGLGLITALIGLFATLQFVYEKMHPLYLKTHIGVSGLDNGGRMGVFLLWLVLITSFTTINLFVATYRYFKKLR